MGNNHNKTTYLVTLTKIVNYEVAVEAASENEAMDHAAEISEADLDANHICGSEISVDYAEEE